MFHTILLRDEEQCKFGLAAFQQAGVTSALVAAVADVFLIDVAVAALQFPYKGAFRYLPGTQKTVFTDIIGEDCQEQRVFPEPAESMASLYKVGSKQRISLHLGNITGESLARQQPVTISDVRVMAG